MIKVLHVDDEPSFAEILSFFLKREGDFQVESVDSGEKALAKMQADKYDAIVADYSMPGMNGIDLLRTIRVQGNDVPFVLFTGRGREDVAISALNSGADFYMEKGSSPTPQFAKLAKLLRKLVETRQSEEAVREGERFLSSVFSSIQDGISVLDRDLNIMRVNPTMERWYEHMAPLVGKKCFEAYHGRDAPCEVCPSMRAIRTGKSAHDEIPRVGPGGEVTGWLDLYSFPMRDSRTGELTGVIEYVRDASDQKRAEAEVKAAQERRKQLEAIIDRSPVIAVLWKHAPGWPVLYVSRNISRFGYSPEELMSGQVVWDSMVHPEDVDRANMEVQEFLQQGKSEFSQEYRMITRSGDVRWVYEQTVVRADASGRPFMQEGIIVDITSRKQAEEKMLETTNTLNAIFSAFPDLYFRVKSDGKILDYHAGRMSDLYVPPEQFLGRRMQEVLPPDLGRAFGDLIAEALKANSVRSLEYPLVTGQEPHFYEARIVPIWKDELLVIVRNISERKSAERALEESETKYRQLADSITDVFFAMDKDLRYTYWNAASERLTGIPMKDAIGKSFADIFQGAEAEEIKARYLEVIRDQRPRSFISQYVLSGKKYFFEIAAYPTAEGLSVLVKDVTRRHEMELELKEANALLQEIILASPEAIAIIDPDDRVLMWNPAAERMFGWKADEVIGRPNPLVLPEARPLYEESRRRELKGESMSAIEVEHVRKDGSRLVVSLSSSPLLDANGRIRGTIGIMIDMTERKRYEEALKQANAKLNQLGHVTRHDALNQLSIMAGWLDIAIEQATGIELRKNLMRIKNASASLQRLLEFTADYQEIGVKEPMWVDLESSIRRGIAGLDLGEISLEIDVPRVEVYADPMLQKVFLNLVDNSLRHGGKVTRIRFHCEESPDGLTLFFEDDGVGIPESDKEAVFERGFGKHTGFGLYMVRTVLGITGIAVRETGAEGSGVRFEMRIPRGGYRGSKG